MSSEFAALYLWRRVGLDLCPPLVGQLGQYWTAEGQQTGATKRQQMQKDQWSAHMLHLHPHACKCTRYLFVGGVWALVSCVVGCGPQVYFFGRSPSLSCRCGLRCLDYLYALGGNSLLFIFELSPWLPIVGWSTPILVIVTMRERVMVQVRRPIVWGQNFPNIT